MPVYEFVCGDCGKEFEVVRTVEEYDPKKVKCPACGSASVEHVWSTVHVQTSKKS